MTKFNLSHGTLGAIAEYKACIWLMFQGYEVYRNVSPNGKFDIIAWKEDEIRKIDVTSYSDKSYKHSNKSKQASAKLHNGYVLYVTADGSFKWDYECEIKNFKFQCDICNIQFESSYTNRKTCSNNKCQTIKQRQRNNDRLRKLRNG